LAVIEALPTINNEPIAVTVPVAVILAEASAIEPPVADTVAVPVIDALPNVVLVANADTSANPFITALPNTNAPLVVTVTVAVAFILAADVLKRVPDALTVASAVMAAEAVTILPVTGKVLNGTCDNTRNGIYYEPNSDIPSPDQSKAFRKNFASIGYTYDKDRDAFIPPQPYPSWTLNEQTCNWDSPIPYPNDGSIYLWNEGTQVWDKVR